MSTQKIITINPDAFKFPGKKKTLKERKTKPFQDANHASNTNKLKRELLKKVKDYQKNKEVEKISEAKVLKAQAPNLFDTNTLESGDFEREFNKSLTFLHDLSKKNKEKKKKKTLKVSNLDVHIDIPTNNLIYSSNKEPNYGCLKNGAKPTFRNLVKTKKNCNQQDKDRLRIVLENNQYYDYAAFHGKYNNCEHAENAANTANTANAANTVNFNLEEPIKLEKEELGHNPESNEQNTIVPCITLSKNETNNLDNKVQALNSVNSLLDNKKEEDKKEEVEDKQSSSMKKAVTYEIDNFIPPKDQPVNSALANNVSGLTPEFKYNETATIPKLCITTKTYKYKLGKNKEKRQIGVLIKNRDTQKRIKREIENLKQEDIQTIKNHLREKGLIKLGSQAPTNILRKMYEDSILSGELNNNNSENLVFNYLNT